MTKQRLAEIKERVNHLREMLSIWDGRFQSEAVLIHNAKIEIDELQDELEVCFRGVQVLRVYP